METPCIVCQENCPVSPKAIFVREHFSTIRGGMLEVRKAAALTVEFHGPALPPDQLATGDYYLRCLDDDEHASEGPLSAQASGAKGQAPRAGRQPPTLRRLIVGNTATRVTIRPDQPFDQPPAPGTLVAIQVRLQRPEVDVKRCIGCGICEHERPVSGKRAIRVTAENETRSRSHSLLL